MKKIIIIFGLLCLTISCVGGFGFDVKKEIMPNYFLIACDDINDLALCYHEDTDDDNYGTLIDLTINAVGFNDKYIIVKQYEDRSKGMNYYILPIKKGMNWRTKNEMLGPLSLNQFEIKRKELNISKLTFNIKIEDL